MRIIRALAPLSGERFLFVFRLGRLKAQMANARRP